jgi:hypothetical protein
MQTRRYLGSPVTGAVNHFCTVLRDKLVIRAISRTDFFWRKCSRRTLPIIAMVITPKSCSKMQQGRLITWLNFQSAQPSKVAQFSVGDNTFRN